MIDDDEQEGLVGLVDKHVPIKVSNYPMIIRYHCLTF